MGLISRRGFLAATAVGAVGVAGAALWEPRRVTVTRNTVRSSLVSGAQAGSVRLVQLTDLHLQEFGAHEEAVAREVNALSPHILVITGDSIDRPENAPILRSFLGALDRASVKFAVLGNWEHWAKVDRRELERTYAAAGCQLLVNETAIAKVGNVSAFVTGLDDSTAGAPDLPRALRGISAESNHIVLAHSPAYRDVMTLMAGAKPASEFDIRSYSIACVLSGHTHGGQVNLLGWAPLRPPGSGSYVSGWYQDSWPALYVSRGIGTSIAPIRLGAPPEVSLFEWQTSAA